MQSSPAVTQAGSPSTVPQAGSPSAGLPKEESPPTSPQAGSHNLIDVYAHLPVRYLRYLDLPVQHEVLVAAY